MGGKKTVGTHPTRGHYQNHSSGRPHNVAGEAGVEIPFTQEFSLFCADVIADTSSTGNAPTSASGGVLPFVRSDYAVAGAHAAPSSHSTPEFGQWYHTSGPAWGGLHGSHSQLSDIETQLSSLKKSIYNLELSVRQCEDVEGGLKRQSGGSGGKNSAELKRLMELLKTVEGRQKSIQSKMSHLDNLFGSSPAAWAQGTDRLRFIMEYFEMMQCGGVMPSPMSCSPYGYPPAHSNPFPSSPYQAYPYFNGSHLAPPSYTTHSSHGNSDTTTRSENSAQKESATVGVGDGVNVSTGTDRSEKLSDEITKPQQDVVRCIDKDSETENLSPSESVAVENANVDSSDGAGISELTACG